MEGGENIYKFEKHEGSKEKPLPELPGEVIGPEVLERYRALKAEKQKEEREKSLRDLITALGYFGMQEITLVYGWKRSTDAEPTLKRYIGSAHVAEILFQDFLDREVPGTLTTYHVQPGVPERAQY